MRSDTKKSPASRKEKLGLIAIAIIMVVILSSCLLGFVHYQNEQNGARHDEIVRAEHQPTHQTKPFTR